jgi:hypothetical protein
VGGIGVDAEVAAEVRPAGAGEQGELGNEDAASGYGDSKRDSPPDTIR